MSDRVDDPSDHLAVRDVAAGHVDIGLGVEGAPLLHQPFQRGSRVGSPKQRPRIASGGPRQEHIDGRIEPDGDRAFLQQCVRALIRESAATGRNDLHALIEQAGDDPPLPISEVSFSKAFKDFPGRQATGIANGIVAVDEIEAQLLRKAPTHGRLAHAHHSDECDRSVEAVERFGHVSVYTAAPKVGQKRQPNPIERNIMSRLTVLIVIVLIVLGALYFLSTRAREVPTSTIEVEVNQATNAK